MTPADLKCAASFGQFLPPPRMTCSFSFESACAGNWVKKSCSDPLSVRHHSPLSMADSLFCARCVCARAFAENPRRASATIEMHANSSMASALGPTISLVLIVSRVCVCVLWLKASLPLSLFQPQRTKEKASRALAPIISQGCIGCSSCLWSVSLSLCFSSWWWFT